MERQERKKIISKREQIIIKLRSTNLIKENKRRNAGGNGK